MHFRVKEIQGTAYITRAVANRIKLEIGDFFYPEEMPTLEVSGALIYWNDTTGEVFTAGETVNPTIGTEPAPAEEAAPVVEPVPQEVPPAPVAE